MTSDGNHDTLQPVDEWDTAMLLCLLRQELDLCDAFIPTLRIPATEIALIRKSIVNEMTQLEVTLNAEQCSSIRRH